MNLVVERLGLRDLSESDVLDVGCGVRFTQAIINRDISINSYTGEHFIQHYLVCYPTTAGSELRLQRFRGTGCYFEE